MSFQEWWTGLRSNLTVDIDIQNAPADAQSVLVTFECQNTASTAADSNQEVVYENVVLRIKCGGDTTLKGDWHASAW